MRILIVEDNLDMASSLKRALRSSYTVESTSLGQEAVRLAEQDFDAIVLDLGLPDMPGLDVCQKARAEGVNSPILVLTADDDPSQKVRLLDAGADDYLTKPFTLDELQARLRAVLRRNKTRQGSTTLTVGDLELDVPSRQVRRAGKEILLRRKEFDLLEYLMQNAGHVVTRSMILDGVWGPNAEIWTNAIDVHVKLLRDKVDKPFARALIKTVHGVGYKIESN
jgi:two-component system, OmpR family, response regulator